MRKTVLNTTHAFITAVLLTLWLASPASAQPANIQWMSLEEVAAKNKTAPKKIFLEIYTEWCDWCKKMDTSTLERDHIRKFLNENFYSVRFDAEQKSEVSFNNKVYKYAKVGTRGYNAFATEMLNGRLSFPSLVFLDEDMQVIQTIEGYKSPEDFEKIITYFATDQYKKVPWSSFIRTYKPMKVKEKN